MVFSPFAHVTTQVILWGKGSLSIISEMTVIFCDCCFPELLLIKITIFLKKYSNIIHFIDFYLQFKQNMQFLHDKIIDNCK